ncbi:vegetative cell wall protein gp1-like [Salvia miltiorrhiza]|uniref:vegetative cell wall protein gp1-like n=1 Tax=Salvia miltiorrhiza TaxID=226208 RepID=UPI0025ACE722|nr:vegetative cell wall protein gp1-like [Salvia miltiorrhiza]
MGMMSHIMSSGSSTQSTSMSQAALAAYLEEFPFNFELIYVATRLHATPERALPIFPNPNPSRPSPTFQISFPSPATHPAAPLSIQKSGDPSPAPRLASGSARLASHRLARPPFSSAAAVPRPSPPFPSPQSATLAAAAAAVRRRRCSLRAPTTTLTVDLEEDVLTG